MFSGIDHMLGHKTNLNTFKRIEIISSIFGLQWYKTRNQLQKEKCEKKKRVETIKYATRKPMGQ